MTGAVSNAGILVGSVLANAGAWGDNTTLSATNYVAGNTLKFYISSLSGTVTAATVQIWYTKN